MLRASSHGGFPSQRYEDAYINAPHGHKQLHCVDEERQRPVDVIIDAALETIDCFCLLGLIEQHRERLVELDQLGVNQFAVCPMHDDPEGRLMRTRMA